jgi:hypothetical protein
MITLIIILAVWLLGIYPAYRLFVSKYKYTTFEKIWFSFFWPAVALLYPIHYIDAKYFGNKN